MLLRTLRCFRWTHLSFMPAIFNDKQNINDEIDKIKLKPQTGLERVKCIFEIDEFGSLSKELISSINTAMATGIFAGVLGGLKESRTKFQFFVTKYNSETFNTASEAKNQLTRELAICFGKGFGWWASRIGFFNFTFLILTNIGAAYSEKLKVYHFTISGFITAALYRIPLGPKAMVGSGLAGTLIGTVGGLLAVSSLYMFGVSYDEIQQWHYKVKNHRDDAWTNTLKKNDLENIQMDAGYVTLSMLERVEEMKNAALEAIKDENENIKKK